MANIINEIPNKKIPIPVLLDDMRKINNQLNNSICKIYIDRNEDNTKTGFLCKIPFSNFSIPVLIMNNSAINKEKIIKLTINKEEKIIKIDYSRTIYIDEEKDLALIEIKPNRDKIYTYDILNSDKEGIGENGENFELGNREQYIYIKENKNGSSCNPILSFKTLKVFGIYFEKNENLNNNIIYMNQLIDKFNKKYFKYKEEINLIYTCEEDNKEENIFGKIFVENNKDNIKLNINNENENKNLLEKYNLKKGQNNIKIIIKNKINNLSHMFDGCTSLKNIRELKFLDTKDINNFSYMFNGISSLSDLKPLENWNVSKGNNFSYMFNGCKKFNRY